MRTAPSASGWTTFSDNYEHVPVAYLPGVPGFEVTAESHPNLFPAFKTAVDKRGTVGLKDQTGWSLAHGQHRARMGDGASAFDCLETLMQTCVGKNFFTYHNDYRGSGVSMDWFFGRSTPFQIDANMGITAAVYEMLVQSGAGFIKLLPALPAELPSGRVTGMRTRAGVTVDLEWQLKPLRIQARFTSGLDQTLSVQLPLPVQLLHEGVEDATADRQTVWNLNLEAEVGLDCRWELRNESLVAVM